MTTEYYSTLTERGRALEAAAMAGGLPVIIRDFVVGDGNGLAVTPDPARTMLVNEVYRSAVSALTVSPEQADQLIAQLVLPADVGGFVVREVGLLTDAGELYALASCPAIEKPVSGVSVSIQFRLAVSDTADVSLAVATGDGLFLRINQNLADIPDKTLARKNLELGDAALCDVGHEAGTVAAGDDERIVDALQSSRNLDTLTDKAAARENLGLGALALKDNLEATDTGAVPLSGGTMSGELSTTNMDSYRIKAGDRAFFLRFDSGNFYILKTAAGDPDGSWDNARPLRINAGDGRVYLGANTRIEGNVYAQDAYMATDGNIYGGCWGGYLSDQINSIRNTANDAWNKANDAQVNRVTDIRFTSEHQVGAIGIYDYRNGNTVLTGFTNGDGDYSAEGLFWSYIQYWRSGQWITVGRS